MYKRANTALTTLKYTEDNMKTIIRSNVTYGGTNT